jgi:drug/metabolite transporter (DMT)-like permease
MPAWLVLALVAVGLPRTILADLDIVEPESGLLYYFLALVPFAAWLAVAVFRKTSKPVMDFFVLGVLYALSLSIVHQVLWNATAGYGHEPTAGAVNFAEKFSPAFQEIALRGYTVGIATIIGVGTGLAVAIVAAVAGLVRARRS